MIPVLIWNLIFFSQLPEAYAAEAAEKGMTGVWTILEHIFRALTFLLPLGMVFGFEKRRQKLGTILYVLGLLIYVGSWIPLMISPAGTWALSTRGFLAPAYTPIIWLLGIWLMSENDTIPRIPARKWFLISAVLFTCIHTISFIVLLPHDFR